ncbi:MAG TPA: hypothetical protein VFY79_14260, partial [Dehalococcoidia bacterium]|nr:hypothetical protein [Dehalococcoidia bacterium]
AASTVGGAASVVVRRVSNVADACSAGAGPSDEQQTADSKKQRSKNNRQTLAPWQMRAPHAAAACF